MRWPRSSSANLVFQDTIERVYVGNKYGDIVRGIYLIRGENVVLLGEIVGPRHCSLSVQDPAREANTTLEQVSVEEILQLQINEQLRQEKVEARRHKCMLDHGHMVPPPPPCAYPAA